MADDEFNGTLADLLARYEALLDGLERLSAVPPFYQQTQSARERLNRISKRLAEMADEVTLIGMQRTFAKRDAEKTESAKAMRRFREREPITLPSTRRMDV